MKIMAKMKIMKKWNNNENDNEIMNEIVMKKKNDK